MATYFRSDGWVKSALGPAVPGAQIYVCTQPANIDFLPPTPEADIFSDPNGLVPITQPILTDGFGHYDFYAVPGLYTLIVVNGGTIQQVYPDQSIGGFGSGTNNTGLIAGTNIQIIGNVISATGGGGASVAIKINGSPVTSQTVLNFTDTASVEWSSDGVGGVFADVDVSSIGQGLGSVHGWYTNPTAITITPFGDAVNFINNGTKVVGTPVAGEGPYIHIVSQAVTNGQGTFYGNIGTLSQPSMWRGPLKYWLARAAMGVGTAHNWWLGMTDRSPQSALMGTDPFSNNNICFYGANTGNFQGYCSDTTASTTVDTGVAVDGAFHTFKMTFASGVVNFFIDGNAVGSITTTLPTTTAVMWPIDTIEANAQNNDLAYMWWGFIN